MSSPASNPFDLTGSFGGFVFTDSGKRRLLLRVGERELLCKVPKELRRRLDANFRLGQQIRLVGVEEKDGGKLVVSRVLPVGVSAPEAFRAGRAACPIRICSKKNCWRQGGGELFDLFKRGLAARGLTAEIGLKLVGCMDRCKLAPNLEWRGCDYRRASAADAQAILARAAADLEPAHPTDRSAR